MRFQKQPGLYVYYTRFGNRECEYYSDYYQFFRVYSRNAILELFVDSVQTRLDRDNWIGRRYGYLDGECSIVSSRSLYDENANYISPYVALEYYDHYLELWGRNINRKHHNKTNGSKRCNYSGFRRPKTTRSKRLDIDDIDALEYGVYTGSHKILPSSWDDIWRYPIKSWKHQSKRNHQYK
jgi:hypothetical protein